MTGGYRKLIHSSFDVLSACEKAFLQYAGMLEQLDGQEFASEAMQSVVADLRQPGVQVHQELLRLHNLAHMGDLRRSSSAHFLFEMLLLWDFHVLRGLEKWKERSGTLARGWINALGNVEALSALAGLAHDNPDWVFPDIRPDTPAGIEAAGLGHPLLREDVRVVNDVEIGPPHSFLLVTGSNMSGKSTLLRAIGVNVVLAQAGGVVCATRFRMRPACMYTSMRVGDSLEQGVSYFMAGVMRLKQIVEAARAHRAGDTDFVYLLDEILQGTNTAERQIAVRNIMAELLSLVTIGAVTTHDLTLAETEELRAASRPVHFSEVIDPTQLENDAMLTFDYKLRPGVATSTNALRLLRLMGIGGRW
jgi:DNA mismatch repair ATPase MutS